MYADFIESVVGQVSFLVYVSNQFLPILTLIWMQPFPQVPWAAFLIFFNCIYSWTQLLLHNHTSIFQLMAAWKFFWYYNWGTTNIKFLYMHVWSHPRAVVTLFLNSCAWDKYGMQVINNKSQGIISATTSELMCNMYVIVKVISYIPQNIPKIQSDLAVQKLIMQMVLVANHNWSPITEKLIFTVKLGAILHGKPTM